MLNVPESEIISKDIRYTAILAYSALFGHLCGEVRQNVPKCEPRSVSLIVDYFFSKVLGELFFYFTFFFFLFISKPNCGVAPSPYCGMFGEVLNFPNCVLYFYNFMILKQN